MRNDLATDLSHERYLVEVDGIAKAEYPVFVKALKASLQLRQELPKCRIKLRDAGDESRSLTHRCRLPLVKRCISATVLELLA